MDIFRNFLTNSLHFAYYIIVYYLEGGDHGRERGWQDNQAMEWHCQVEYFQKQGISFHFSIQGDFLHYIIYTFVVHHLLTD